MPHAHVAGAATVPTSCGFLLSDGHGGPFVSHVTLLFLEQHIVSIPSAIFLSATIHFVAVFVSPKFGTISKPHT